SDGHGEIKLSSLLKQTLRMRPDRIVLGECRGKEIFDLLQLLNSGHSGSLATIHANSAYDTLKRIELLCLLHNTIPHATIQSLIGLGVQWICHIKREEGERIISEICKVENMEHGMPLL
ncbi:MAG: hypothetical protein CUN55_20530, partial [Phototrophicales bacterium]